MIHTLRYFRRFRYELNQQGDELSLVNRGTQELKIPLHYHTTKISAPRRVGYEIYS